MALMAVFWATLLGQVAVGSAGGGKSTLNDVIIASAWLLAAVVGVAAVVFIIRRLTSASQAPAQEPFTLDDLRQLHQQGQLSDEEFERAKAKIAVRLKERILKDPTGQPDPPAAGGTSQDG